MSYASRMALSFALTSFMTVIILVVVVTIVWGGAFSDYTRANMDEIASFLSNRLAAGYVEQGGWSTTLLASVAESGAVSDDIGMQVIDTDGTILYDDTWPTASIAAEIKREEQQAAAEAQAQEAEVQEDVAQEGTSEASSSSDATGTGDQSATDTSDAASSDAATTTDDGSSVHIDDGNISSQGTNSESNTHSLVSQAPTNADEVVSCDIALEDGTSIGTVRLWVLGSDALLTKADSAFRDNTFNAMTLASCVAIIIAVCIGFFVSRMLTNPIRRITSTAQQIRDGDLTARTDLRGEDEIDQLGETFDEMATSLEKDLTHERRLTSDVAHELRTPLMAMLATVEAMQDGVYPTDPEHLETVASETRRLARLVQQMLDLSRMENKTVPLNIEAVDIAALARNIVTSQHQLFHDHDLHLRFNDDTQGKNPVAEVDPDMLTQAIINIMSNAMRYTPEDGWVVVTVSGDRREMLITVSDTGIGIAKDDLSRIFGRFWRADASRAREAGGLGVGLAVTRGIIERHHGFISVESELDKGTTFTLHIPREYTPDVRGESAETISAAPLAYNSSLDMRQKDKEPTTDDNNGASSH